MKNKKDPGSEIPSFSPDPLVDQDPQYLSIIVKGAGYDPREPTPIPHGEDFEGTKCVDICVFINLFLFLHYCLTMYLSIYLFIYLFFIFLFIYLFIYCFN